MNDITLSIVVLGHHEGLLAHKTMLSVLRALENLENENITYEVIIHIDNGDDATIDYFSRYHNDSRIRIIESSFSDIALSRNRATELARGEYVTFVDGDDLISKNWFAAAVKVIQAEGSMSVARAETIVSMFPESDDEWPIAVQFSKNSGTIEYEAIRMLARNPWPAFFVASRSLLLAYPFQENQPGFGSEDFAFNGDLIADGIRQVIVPETILFYRRRADSSLARQTRNKAVFHYSRLFDTAFIQSIQLPEFENNQVSDEPKDCIVRKLSRIASSFVRWLFDFVLRIPGLRNIAARMYSSWKKRNHQTTNNLPEWLIQEWKELNVIDFTVFPRASSLKNLTLYEPVAMPVGWAYRQLVEGLAPTIDYLIIVPWLIRGGADKVVLHYVDAFSKLYPEMNVAVLATVERENTWRYKLPDNVGFIDYGNLTKNFGEYEKDLLLNRLIVQLKVKSLHIINSMNGYQWAADHSEFLQQVGINLVSSVFCHDINDEGMFFSYSDPALRNIYPYTNIITTDNHNVRTEISDNNGYDKDRIVVHYMPVDLTLKPVKLIEANRPIRILWASRVMYQKRPDILKEIALRIDSSKYHIDVYGERDEHIYPLSFLNNIPSLTYKGGFNDIEVVLDEDYDLFLYTTQSDGVPNILLEIVAGGLPIVASNRGGVDEIIQDGHTGLLVDDIEDIDAYLQKIDQIVNNPTEAKIRAENAQKLLVERHNTEVFVNQVAKDFSPFLGA